MPLQFAANAQCDIYRNATYLAEGAPDVLNIGGYLFNSYFMHSQFGHGDTMSTRYSAWILLPYGTDIRDDFNAGTYGTNFDVISIPAGQPLANGTQFKVVKVETRGLGTHSQHLKVYLDRYEPSWPSKLP
jgi:hypothetical protein